MQGNYFSFILIILFESVSVEECVEMCLLVLTAGDCYSNEVSGVEPGKSEIFSTNLGCEAGRHHTLVSSLTDFLWRYH